jgi:uncharacterized protein YjbI with pentapeptide repeats
MGEAQRIVFEDCDLNDSDFYSASLQSTRFFDCNLSNADFSQAKLPGARFHGSTLYNISGAVYLTEVVIDTNQVMQLALQVFGSLGIRVEVDQGSC